MAGSVSVKRSARVAMAREAGTDIALWRWAGAAALIAAAVVLPFTLSNYHVFEATQHSHRL
jgi:hypothetical protein